MTEKVDITREELIQLLSERRSDKVTNNPLLAIMPMLDGLMKVLFPVVAYFGVHMFEKIDSFSKQITELSIQQEYSRTQLQELKMSVGSFNGLPRFSKENFESEVKPLKQEIDSNATMIRSLNDSKGKLEDRMNKLEVELSLIKRSAK